MYKYNYMIVWIVPDDIDCGFDVGNERYSSNTPLDFKKIDKLIAETRVEKNTDNVAILNIIKLDINA